VSIGRQRVRVRRRERESEPLERAKWSVNVPRVSQIEKRESWNNERNGACTGWECMWRPYSESHAFYKQASIVRGVEDGAHQILTDRKAWTMSALTELRGLSLITTKICSSFSRPMKFPNHDFLASLVARQELTLLYHGLLNFTLFELVLFCFLNYVFHMLLPVLSRSPSKKRFLISMGITCLNKDVIINK